MTSCITWSSNWWWLQWPGWRPCSWWMWIAGIWQWAGGRAMSAVIFLRRARGTQQVRGECWYPAWPFPQPLPASRRRGRRGRRWGRWGGLNWQCKTRSSVEWWCKRWCPFQLACSVKTRCARSGRPAPRWCPTFRTSSSPTGPHSPCYCTGSGSPKIRTKKILKSFPSKVVEFWWYLITGEGPRPEFHNTRLLIEGKVSDIYCTGALQEKKGKDERNVLMSLE